MTALPTDQQLASISLELESSRAESRALRETLWKLASNPFLVLGQARVSDHGITLTVFGDLPPEPRLGMAPGSFPKTIEATYGLLHPDDRTSFQQVVERSLITGEPFDMNYRVADGHGGWRWIEGRAVSSEVRDGRHLTWVFTNRDFTSQHAAEEALSESVRSLELSRAESKSQRERLWRTAANAFTVLGEAHLTAEGFNLEYFGDSAPESKIGLRPGSMPKSVEEVEAIIHPADLKPYQKNIARSLATGEPFRSVYRLSDGRGGWRWLQSSAISQEEREGRHVRWLFDNIDITERKETEEALRQSLEELRHLKAQLQSDNQFLREEAERATDHGAIIGRSPAVARVLEQVELVGATSSIVLITGETGTGKDLVARAIHQRSDRRQRLFVAVNCAALPASLVESELFGHEKGAFTGAIARRAGRFEQADGGTLFLDEVGELPLEAQAKMLRVLQSGEFERVGGNRLLRTSVRVIAATNRDLEEAVHRGHFRSDLYHRLAVFPIHLPPIRERREDIPLLAAYLVTRKARQLKRHIEPISPDVLDLLIDYDWPGNVRELENVLERAIILTRGSLIAAQSIHLAPVSHFRPGGLHSEPATPPIEGETDTLQARERAHIHRVCEATAWRIKGPHGAAVKLGLNPGTLYSRMKKLGIRRPRPDITAGRP